MDIKKLILSMALAAALVTITTPMALGGASPKKKPTNLCFPAQAVVEVLEAQNYSVLMITKDDQGNIGSLWVNPTVGYVILQSPLKDVLCISSASKGKPQIVIETVQKLWALTGTPA